MAHRASVGARHGMELETYDDGSPMLVEYCHAETTQEALVKLSYYKRLPSHRTSKNGRESTIWAQSPSSAAEHKQKYVKNACGASWPQSP